MISQLISSFNSGEWSPYLEARTNLEKYRNSCKTLENMVITPYGPANRRAGTEYLGAAKLSGTRCRLIGMDISDTNHIVMELGVGYIRFWKNGALITSGGNPVEAVQVDYLNNTTGLTPAHPYQEADLRAVQVCQINNLVYLTHPSYPPQRLSRLSDTSWTIGEVPFGDASIKNNWAPMLDQNVKATTITPSATTGTSITLTASSGIFKAGHVGSYWELAHPNPTTFITRGLATNGTSDTIEILGKWSLQTFGTWTAQLDLEKSTDDGATWTVARTYKSSDDYNATSSGEETVRTLFRLTVKNTGADSSNATLTIANKTATITGFGYNVAAGQQITVVSSDATQSNNKALGTFTAKTVSAAKGTLTISGTTATLTGTSYTASAGQQITVASNESTQDVNADKMLGVFTIATASATAITYTVPSGAKVPTGDITFQNSATSTTITYEVPVGTTVPTGTITFSKGSSRAMLSPIDPTLKGLVRITGFTSSTSVTALVLKSLGGTGATSQWREGAFSAVQGYPAAVALHDSRIIFAGTASNPSSLWGSYSNDFQNFRQGAYDADSWFFTLASTTGGQIQWIVSKSALLIGTTLDEWSMAASDATRPITPTNVNVRQQSHYGSSLVGAQIINDTILFIQRMSRKIRELVYTWASESWVSNDVTALAEHTTRTGILETAYQRVPDAILWFIRGDGQLVSMTYEREQQVVGFARHITDGTFESVATINGTNAEDEVYVLVKRTINGATVRYVERFKLGMREALDTADKSNWWYVDAGKIQTFGSPTSTITGLSHLEGKTVSVWADNAVGSLSVSQPTVVGGQITLQIPASRVLVGLPFTSTLVPQRVDTNLQDGTSQGRRMRIPRINLKVYQSTGGEISTDGVNWNPLVSRTLTDAMDSSPPVLNGYERAYASSNWADGVDLYVRQTQPVPLTVAALVVNFEVSEATQN
jgi:hypothetical protein